MALGYNVLVRSTNRGTRVNVVELTVNTYATGGLALTPNSLGLNTLTTLTSGVSLDGYVGVHDRTNAKLLVLFSDNNNAADGPLIEIPDTTALATTKIVVTAYGT